ncbi:MAG: DUF58 domain-containing protein [Clostridia bacterium]|nr:DUF58 domain-containing protein [Clostridia bacterium]
MSEAMTGKILDGAFLDALETFDLYRHQLTNGHYSGARRSGSFGSSPEFADYRDYVPGDDLRRIDWNLAGRFDKYYIKRFIDEKQGKNRVYLDMSASMGQDAVKGFKALQLAAAMGYLSVSNMDCVQYRLLREEKCEDLCGSIIGRESFFNAVRRLEDVEYYGSLDFFSAIRDDPSPGFNDGVSSIISDFLTDSNWKGAIDYLINRHREVAIIQILSPEELEPSYSGAYSFFDAEFRKEKASHVDVNRDALIAYKKAVSCFLNDIRHFCASRAVSYMMARSDERIEEALLTKGCAEGLIQ